VKGTRSFVFRQWEALLKRTFVPSIGTKPSRTFFSSRFTFYLLFFALLWIHDCAIKVSQLKNRIGEVYESDGLVRAIARFAIGLGRRNSIPHGARN
jgi:hypothetical protein